MMWRNGMRGVYVAGMAVVLAAGGAEPAVAQDMQNLLNRLDRMERDMQDLQRQLYRGGGSGITATPVTPAPITGASASSPSASGTGEQGAALDTGYAARVEVRLQQLETLIRSLTGKIEEVEFKVDQNAGRIDRLVRDVDFRLQALEQGGVAAPADGAASSQSRSADAPAEEPVPGQGQGVFGYLKESEVKALEEGTAEKPLPGATASSESAAAAPAPAESAASLQVDEEILPDGTPEEQYRHAFAYLQKQDFYSAERALGLFLERHPKNPLAGNAIYWLGETFYVRKDFARAAKTFATGYTDYPGSSKTADNLLKLAFSLARMDRKEDACVTFDRLEADFPNASANIKRRAATERKRIGC